MQPSSTPVSAQEIQLVKDILARMEARGTLIPHLMWSMGHLGAMTDGSKRQRDSDDFPSSEEESVLGKMSGRGSDEFELIRGSSDKGRQKPVPPKSKPELPEGVESVEKWGTPLCAL